MGRKIPGKKHKKLKDPEVQRQRRFSEIENKINAPPQNVEDQAVPKSLERLVKLKNLMKNKPIMKKKKKKKTNLISVGSMSSKKMHPNAKPEKVVPIFNQRPNESEENFMHRVNRETADYLKETEFEKKFHVQVKRNINTGEVEGLEKAPKDELDELVKMNSKHQNMKKKKKGSEEEQLSKSQKKRKKELLKKQKKSEQNLDDFGSFKAETIKFGEIAHAPPNIKTLPRKAANLDSAKLGKKALLLNSLFEEKKETKTQINRTRKRKDLPVGERRQLEEQQKEAIEAYRLLKTKK